MSPSRATGNFRLGAQVGADGVDFRVWSPNRSQVRVHVRRGSTARTIPLAVDGDNYWSGKNDQGRAGDLYWYLIDGDDKVPDVASRFQPEGVHGPSECIEASAYPWKCVSWRRPAWRGQTTYEIHLGTFTPEGTFHAAIGKLAELRDLGIEAIELMPVADFAGERNWGYDGVALFAPARCYGRPDDLRELVDTAHGLGLAVILDVVYNHVGPQGSYLDRHSPFYLRSDRPTPWGKPFNLDGPQSAPVRNFLLSNVGYWLEEFRFDGLRLDATHAIPDTSSRHLLSEIVALVHSHGAFVIGEDDRNKADLLRPDKDATAFDALWADDFHHEVRVALTRTQATYFSAYRGTTAGLAQTIENGWSYRGQSYRPWNGRSRGTPCRDLPPRSFVYCIENHDQVGNRAAGERLEHLVQPGQFRAASMLLCLAPYAPLLFMGQDWAASSAFMYFTDHGGALGKMVSEGRKNEFGHFKEANAPEVPDPEAAATFQRSKLNWPEAREGLHAATRLLYRESLRERHNLRDLGALERDRWTVRAHGDLLAIQYRLSVGSRMLLVALNEGFRIAAHLAAICAPLKPADWHVLLSSECPRFGGTGAATSDAWGLEHPGAIWLAADGNGATHGAR